MREDVCEIADNWPVAVVLHDWMLTVGNLAVPWTIPSNCQNTMGVIIRIYQQDIKLYRSGTLDIL